MSIKANENGRVNLGSSKEEIIKNTNNKGFDVDYHTDYYMNNVSVTIDLPYIAEESYGEADYSIGFYNWAHDADFLCLEKKFP